MAQTTAWPYPIALACARACAHEAFNAMPESYLRILLRIILRLRLDAPSSPILYPRERLAEETGKSVETVHRALRWLETQGFIERTRRARARLAGSVSPIAPTRRLLKILGLDRTVSRDRSRSAEDPVSPKTQPTPVDNPPGERSTVRVGRFSIPLDLAWLTDKGLTPQALCRLMRLARERGKRLSDIASVTRSRLMALEPKALYAYLLALIQRPIDFAHEARALREKARLAEEDARRTEEAKAQVGQWFQDRSGRFLKIINPTWAECWADGRLAGMVRLDATLMAAIRNGQLARKTPPFLCTVRPTPDEGPTVGPNREEDKA